MEGAYNTGDFELQCSFTTASRHIAVTFFGNLQFTVQYASGYYSIGHHTCPGACCSDSGQVTTQHDTFRRLRLSPDKATKMHCESDRVDQHNCPLRLDLRVTRWIAPRHPQ